MTGLETYTYAGQHVRTVMVDGEPWFIAGDVTELLGYANGRTAIAAIPDRMKSSVQMMDGTPGNPNRAILNEAGVNRLIMRSTLPEAERVQDWIAEYVLPSIRKTGAYGPAPIDLSTPQGVLALAEQLTTTARELVAVTARAEAAEEFKEAIELNDGITPREFHKKYLPGCTESEFNAALYRHRLLIDQTGQRSDGKGGRKPGKQHRHPTYQGKAFFYLHSELDRDKIRREHVRVIPGEAELLLVKWCAARGLITTGLAVAS